MEGEGEKRHRSRAPSHLQQLQGCCQGLFVSWRLGPGPGPRAWSGALSGAGHTDYPLPPAHRAGTTCPQQPLSVTQRAREERWFTATGGRAR